jgi:hypothetical protein
MLITRRFPSVTDILTSFAEGVQDAGAGSISHPVGQLVLTIEITSGWWASALRTPDSYRIKLS